MEKFVLPPGFRFHPTDEELVSHYLRRKICGRKIDFEAIGEVDLYNYEPWDLPDKSFLRTRDLEWYFFIPRDRKYPNGSRTNRATEKGYWKSTGKDRFVSSGSRNLGTKKTLVYYNGRAPKGERTNWVMHEYRLNDAECQRINASENGFVLCRIFQKSGAGPKNGEQYGAPVEDEEFDKLPPLEGDGGASFEACKFEPGPHSVSGHCNSSPTGAYRNEASSHEDNKVEVQFTNGGLQPRNLKFPDLLGNMESDCLQVENVTNPNGTGSNVLPAYGVQDILPQACLEEDDILQDLYKLLKTGEQWGSTYATNNVETGFYQCGAQPPSDGDYLELNDLISVSDCEDGIEAIKTNNKQMNGGLKAFSDESECSSLLQMQALPMFPNIPCDCSSPCPDLPAGCGIHEKQRNLAEMQSSVSTVTYDSQCQSFQGDLLESLIATSGLYNEELGTACQTDSGEPDLEEVFELFARAKEDKSFNVESFAENIQREVLPSEDTSLISSQDGQYYDALLSFTDADMYGETRSTAMDIANNFGVPQMTLAQASLSSQVGGVLEKLAVDRFDNTEHSEGVVKPHEFVSESVLLSQGEGINLGQVKHSPSPLSLLWRSCLETLPTSPASAADFSPKAISPGGPIHVTATGVGVNAVSVTGTCVSDDTASSCIKCSVAEAKNTGRFVKSLSVIRQRSKPSDKWRIGYYTSAIFGGLWAVFWLFIAGGAWKLFGGLYRKMVASEP